MSARQIHGAAAVLLSALAAVLLSGVARHYLASGPANGDIGTASRAASRALAGGPPTRLIKVPAGFRLEQVASIVSAALGTSSGHFLAIAASPDQAKRRGVDAPSLEGFLAPGTYAVPSGSSDRALLDEMVSRFQSQLTPGMLLRARELHLSIRQVVTLASIVQREATFASDMPAIAGVFLNRLRAGMPLQADPTLQYALESAKGVPDANQYWTTDIVYADYDYPSPYNAFLHRGLPPGPIDSPSPAALKAVLYAPRVPYLYFVGTPNRSTAFARTLAEHERNVAQYLRRHPRPSRGEPGLRGMLERLAQGIDGHIGVVVENLATGERAAVNPRDFFTAASLYKLFVLDAAFERRSQRRLRFDRQLPIPAEAARLDPPAIRARLGARPTVTQALLNMIDVSSNAAGVTLMHTLGKPYVTRVIRRQGLDNTFLTEAELITTPEDVARILELIARGHAVNAKASRQMRTMLLRQEINGGLPHLLPRGTPVAHKTGTLAHSSHDAGIVYTPAGPILIVAMTEDVPDPARATQAIARLAQLVVDYFMRYRPVTRTLAAAGSAACPDNPFRPRTHGVLSGKTVVLDPGGGGSVRGATFAFPDGFVLTEKAVDLDVALRLTDLLTARGATVYLTRCRDVTLSPIARAGYANSVPADVLLSLHLNSSRERTRDGTQAYYLTTDGHVLANYLIGSFTLPALWQTLSASLALPNGGAHRQALDVLVYARARGVLTKSAFLSNPAEAAALRAGSGQRRQQIALGHLRGILGYFAAQRTQTRSLGRPVLPAAPAREPVVRLSPRQKAALLVVSGLPAPEGVGGVIVSRSTRELPRPSGALVFANQEGGSNRTFPTLQPALAAAEYTSAPQAFAAGKRTAAGLRRAGVQVDLAPVLDSRDGPLGVRQFADPAFAIAFARGLAARGVGSCAKHFPGLGSTLVSTDRAQAYGVVRPRELAGFETAVRTGAPCVMVGNAIYPQLGPRSASLEPAAYRLLRQGSFDGVAITDDLDLLGPAASARAARVAIEAGADLVLLTNAADAKRAIAELVPLARAGLLDEHVRRVLRLRRALASR